MTHRSQLEFRQWLAACMGVEPEDIEFITLVELRSQENHAGKLSHEYDAGFLAACGIQP